MEGWKYVAPIHVALLTVQLIFSFNQIVSKIGLKYFHPSVFLFMRCILVSPIMILIAKIKEKEFLPKTRKEALLILLMGFFSFLAFEAFLFGIQVTSVTTATTLQATSPLWTLLIALALKMEGPSFMKIGGVICAILGAVVSIAGNHVFQLIYGDGPGSTPSGNKDFPGGLLLIANAIFYSCSLTVQKYVLRTVKPLTATAWSISLVAFMSFFVSIGYLDTVNLNAVSLQGWLSVAYVSIVSMAIANSLLSWAAKQTSTTVVAVYSTVMPVLSPIMGFFMLGELISIIQILGLLVTVAGVFLVIRARHVEEKKRKLRELSENSTEMTIDDVASSSDTATLLESTEKEREGKEDNDMSENNNNKLQDSDEEIEIEIEIEKKDGAEIIRRGKFGKGGYAIVGNDVELREMASV